MSTTAPKADTLPFTPEEKSEIDMYVAHYRLTKGVGKVTIELNFNGEEQPSTVVVNGRRFKRHEG